mmetsp:Transcript_67665/g.180905  ORF Transcript_67665/g.180905 Transcript_67665/m.180905 type:complete len:157 (-) Transcript_67665:541-1011(-)
MALIEVYEEQYLGLVKGINEKLDKLSSVPPSSERWNGMIKAIEQDIQVAEEIQSKLDMEVRRLKGDSKTAFQTRCKQYRIDIGVCKETLETHTRQTRASRDPNADREELFSGATANGNSEEYRINLTKSADQRSRMVNATSRLEASSDRLKESRCS